MLIMIDEMWGELPSLEGTTQITRSMLDMRNPRSPTASEELVCLNIKEHSKEITNIPKCPYTRHSIELLDYINEMERTIAETSELSRRDIKLPAFPELDDSAISPRPTKWFSAPSTRDRQSRNEIGIDASKIDDLTLQGVATIAKSLGYEASTKSAVLVLNDITKQYFETFGKLFRHALDNEALTGRTGFYDCVDQVLHDMDIDGIHGIKRFYKEKVIDHHTKLVQKGQKLKKDLKLLKTNTKSKQVVKVKQEKPAQIGWVPVQTQTERNTTGDNSRWFPFVKTEPYNQSQSLQETNTSPAKKFSYVNSFRSVSPTQEEYKPTRKKIRK